MRKRLNEVMQYYGIDKDGRTVYVAMSEEQVKKYAKLHPEEGIVRVEDKFNHGYNLREALKEFDRKQFENYSNTYELEMLYESVKDTLSAQQKNDLVKFVRKARTAEEINTYMTGMLAKGQMSEAFDKEPHEFWYYTKHGLGPGAIPRDVEILDVKEDDNWGTYIKLDKVLTTDELNKYEIKEKVPPNELTEEVDEIYFNDFKDLAYELDNYIEDKVWVRDFWYDGQFENTISFEIYGDWKHDHARFDYYASEWLDNKGLKYKIWENVTDDDGSDSYGATHTIRLYDFVNESPLEEGIKQDREKIIKSFIEQCLEKLDTFGDETDAELEVPDKLDNNAFYDDLEQEAEKNGIRLSIQETNEFPGGVYLYYYIRHDNIDEGYIPQKETKFSNGTLKEFDPYPFMQKVADTGQSLHTVRTVGDDYYTIFVMYQDFFGPRGADNPDTEYEVDIIKEDMEGNQERVLLKRHLLRNEAAELLQSFREQNMD